MAFARASVKILHKITFLEKIPKSKHKRNKQRKLWISVVLYQKRNSRQQKLRCQELFAHEFSNVSSSELLSQLRKYRQCYFLHRVTDTDARMHDNTRNEQNHIARFSLVQRKTFSRSIYYYSLDIRVSEHVREFLWKI